MKLRFHAVNSKFLAMFTLVWIYFTLSVKMGGPWNQISPWKQRSEVTSRPKLFHAVKLMRGKWAPRCKICREMYAIHSIICHACYTFVQCVLQKILKNTLKDMLLSKFTLASLKHIKIVCKQDFQNTCGFDAFTDIVSTSELNTITGLIFISCS